MISRRFVLGAGVAASAAAPFPVFASQVPDLPKATLSALDQEIAGKLTAGGAVVAVRNGQTVGQYFWGKASLPFDAPVSDQTLFHLGSNGKIMTAVAVMQVLRASGTSVETPIGELLPNLPPVIAAIPLARLMSHTSGLPDYSQSLTDWDRPQPREVIEKAIVEAPIEFAAGEAWNYSNTNYVVLGWLIEHLSGLSYTDYVAQKLFAPAGTPTARADAANTPMRHRAEPYEISPEGVFTHAVRMDDGVSRAADGGILMSARDVAPWRAALASNRLLPADDMARINGSMRLNSGRRVPYGFGTFTEQRNGRPCLHHSGGVPGFISYWRTWPDTGLSILAVSNSGAPPIRSPDLSKMLYAMAEGIEPGRIRPITRLGAGSDQRTQALSRLVSRAADAPVEEGLLAPEKTVSPKLLPRPASNVEDLHPMEAWFMGDSPDEGEMVRYGYTRNGRQREVLVGWTPENQIYWI